MKEQNKSFISTQTFYDRVTRVMKYKGISMDSLYNLLIQDVGYQITKNNLNLYIQRIPNVNFLIALSKALGVSTDYLLGVGEDNLFNLGFNYNYTTPNYIKYIGDYFVYFYPTVCNSPKELIKAKLSIELDSHIKVSMKIVLLDGREKCYEGKLLLSDTYNVCYIIMQGIKFGEMVSMSFLDPALNAENAKFQLALGVMLSVSSGDLKRVPVMSKFLISKDEIPEGKISIVGANLRLNTKYIYIEDSQLDSAIEKALHDDQKIQEGKERIRKAFMQKKYFSVEESFIINTIQRDLGLSFYEGTELLASLREYSMSSANIKINKALDSRIYKYIFETDSDILKETTEVFND